MEPQPPPLPEPEPPLMPIGLSNTQKLQWLSDEVPLIEGISALDRDGFLKLATRYELGRCPRSQVVVPYDTIGEVKPINRDKTHGIDTVVFPHGIKKPANEDL
ncbi:hypothetical protein E2562_004655 [Oryza meyeriana var. granulata]|uniref:Uncharacterized protein n=1 Tax=Oryza meyeriana var. granulata TaxID=110450 RepID=A0A6G1DE19_9ORYZ|nr:hypothetical protein E2562_004655 [Oryza meyeriana var. granulata]